MPVKTEENKKSWQVSLPVSGGMGDVYPMVGKYLLGRATPPAEPLIMRGGSLGEFALPFGTASNPWKK